MLVYIREAHAEDEWAMESNRADGVSLIQPRTADERCDVDHDFGEFEEVCDAACALVERLDIGVPTLVDDMDDTVGRAYGAWPERIYVIEADGRIGYQGGYGPFDFEPAEAAAFLERLVGPPAPPGP